MNKHIDVTDTALLDDALAGLMARQKYIDPKWLYDSAGSALFEEITAIPPYYLTRTETAILRANAPPPVGGACPRRWGFG